MVTHVLLPVLALLRRLDLAAVIVEALVARHLKGESRAEVTRSAGAAYFGEKDRAFRSKRTTQFG
jgi:hypothetical protein